MSGSTHVRKNGRRAAAQTWYLEDEIFSIKAARAEKGTGVYGTPSDPYLTANAAMRDPGLRLQPDFICAQVDAGNLEPEYFHRKTNPHRDVVVFPRRDLLRIKKMRDPLLGKGKGKGKTRYFGGEYPDGRISLRRAAGDSASVEGPWIHGAGQGNWITSHKSRRSAEAERNTPFFPPT